MIRSAVYRLTVFDSRVYQVLVCYLCISNTELCRPTGYDHFQGSIVCGERLPEQAGSLVTEES
jgi:hypothetical protein